MRKLSFLLAFVIYLSSYGVVSAASLSLNMIGALDVSDSSYSQYWYTGGSPVLSGTAAESSTVTVTVNDTATNTTADASGNWSQGITLNDGDNSVVITDGTDTYSFTLTKGDLPANISESTTTTTTTTTTEETTTLPDAGGGLYTLLMMGMGAFALTTSAYILQKAR